jgi:hypothetical protein
LEFTLNAPSVAVRILGILCFALYVGRGSWRLKNRSKEPNVNAQIAATSMNWSALFCVICGGEMIKVPKENPKRQSTGPSYKTIALVIGIIFVAGIFFKIGITFFKEEGSPRFSSSSVSASNSPTVDEAQVLAVARNFKCACGGCGELPLATCQCEMPKGSVEEKRFIREKLVEGYTVEQVIEMVDKKYGHRV